MDLSFDRSINSHADMAPEESSHGPPETEGSLKLEVGDGSASGQPREEDPAEPSRKRKLEVVLDALDGHHHPITGGLKDPSGGEATASTEEPAPPSPTAAPPSRTPKRQSSRNPNQLSSELRSLFNTSAHDVSRTQIAAAAAAAAAAEALAAKAAKAVLTKRQPTSHRRPPSASSSPALHPARAPAPESSPLPQRRVAPSPFSSCLPSLTLVAPEPVARRPAVIYDEPLDPVTRINLMFPQRRGVIVIGGGGGQRSHRSAAPRRNSNNDSDTGGMGRLPLGEDKNTSELRGSLLVCLVVKFHVLCFMCRGIDDERDGERGQRQSSTRESLGKTGVC